MMDREQMRNDLTAWLGDARDDLTDEQLERLTDEAMALAEQYPGPDGADDRETALTATTQHILGETDLLAAGNELAHARAALRWATVQARTLARLAVADGVSEVETAARLGVDRMTVREWLGKRRR